MTPAEKKRVDCGTASLALAVDMLAEIFYRDLFEQDPRLRELFRADLAREAAKTNVTADIFGHGVNVAARLERPTEPGGFWP